jgi:hypothetical protein
MTPDKIAVATAAVSSQYRSPDQHDGNEASAGKSVIANCVGGNPQLIVRNDAHKIAAAAAAAAARAKIEMTTRTVSAW